MEKFISCEEQDDLRIVEHLDMQNLPTILQNMLSLASTPEEKDILPAHIAEAIQYRALDNKYWGA